jgi:glycosyltransferase involved in cell wall biosynthesis
LTYIENLIPELANSNKGIEYYMLVQKNLDFDIDLPESCKIIPVSIPFSNALLRMLYEQLILPIRLHLGKFDLLFSPAGTTVLLTPVPSILAIRTSNPFTNIKIKRPLVSIIKIELLKFLLKLFSLKAKKVLFVSNWSKSAVSRKFNIPAEKTLTIYHGIDSENFKTGIKNVNKEFKSVINNYGRYILSVSTIYPHKNFEVLIRAYKKLNQELKQECPKLVIAGKKEFTNYYRKLAEMIEKFGLNDKVVFTGKIKYKYMPYLYNNALVFVLPSFLETFGHPLIEAMSSGVPIIASNSTAIPEIVRRGGMLFDPNNPVELCEKIKMVLQDPKLRQKLKKEGLKRAKDFSWKKTARETLSLLEEVYYGKKH